MPHDKTARKPETNRSFAVVAVGASAGGLEAFSELLRSLPANTGMAFVFIQHLDPTHPSMLPELLAKTSRMPVLESKNGQDFKANHVYVMPPNVNMKISGDRFRLTPRASEPGLHTPIDYFMRSLAEGRNRRAIGVVLSGTASDGTRGLAAIKAEGGITFAQDEKSAKYPGMPHSAVASGCVDFVLPPGKIARELAKMSGHSYLGEDKIQPKLAPAEPEHPHEDLTRIFAALRKTGGADFSQYKSGTVQRRALRRMAIHKIERVSDYAKFLERHPKEVQQLYQDLLIPVTSFFRDLEAFESLKKKVLPTILKDKSANKSIRVWTPGCSTGEETYSLAMILLEFLGDRASSYQIQLFGTDANERGIEKARAGIYHERISHEVSPMRMRRFFTTVDEGYRISRSIRDMCVFARQNVAEDPPFSHMNLVVCRNLLIYLGQELQRKVIPVLHYALRPNGFLFLGNAESVAGFQEFFAPFDKKHKIFVKKPIAGRLHYDFSANRYPRETAITDRATARSKRSLGLDQQHEADRVVLNAYAPPEVVIDENMEILQFRGAIGPYIEPSPGKATLHLFKIARKEFVAELRLAVNEAKKHHTAVKRRTVEFKRNGKTRSVNISIEPLMSTGEDRQYLILFERILPTVQASGKSARFRARSGSAKSEFAELRRKLTATEDHLRATIESKEASEEEYQSANEEILSANEELQSTNEELETSKEELQSANEELNTVNDELHTRNAELDRTNSDLRNLLANTTLPVVMVDRGLRIRRLTAASSKILRIVPSDIGRPLTDIRWNLDIPNLEELILGVIETLTPKEVETQDKEHHWYSLQIRPYRTTDDKIDGAVLVLTDIDDAKQASERIKKANVFMQEVLDTVREPLVVLTTDLKIVYVNPSFLRTFGVTAGVTEGKLFYTLGNGQWNIPKLQKRLGEATSKETALLDFEVEHDFPKLGKKTMLLNARKIDGGHRDEALMLLAIEDVTERREREREREREGEGALAHHSHAIQELSTKLLRSQDEERRKIARELHDSIGQQLVYAKMSVETINKGVTTEKESQTLSHVAEALDRCLTETRTISYLLHPPFLETVGFRSAAKWYLEGFAERSGIRVNLNMPAEQKRSLRGNIELVLFRILQESLTNVHRHSKSASVDVRLEVNGSEVVLEVRDHGKGISDEVLERFRTTGDGAGVGLSSMRERVNELGGRLEIQSDEGAVIRVFLPLPDVSGDGSKKRVAKG